jgi:hypothetical protein
LLETKGVKETDSKTDLFQGGIEALVLELDELIDHPLDSEHFLTIIRGNLITNSKVKQAYTELIDKATLYTLTKHTELFIVAS